MTVMQVGPGNLPNVRNVPPERIEIVDQNGHPVHQTDRVIGELVTFMVRNVPSGLQLANITWTVGGQTVDSYVQNRGSTTRVGLQGLHQQQIDFHWIASGQNVALTVNAEIVNPPGPNIIPAPANVTINVQGPPIVNMVTIPGIVRVGNTGYPNSGIRLSCGNAAAPGVDWVFTATGPTPVAQGIQNYGTGQLQVTQLVNSTVTERYVVPPIGYVSRRFDTGGVMVLDNPNPYWNWRVPIPRGGAGRWTAEDTPSVPLIVIYNRVTDAASFETYFMYKPNTPNSIWVTIGLLTWNYAGTTNLVGGVWGAPVTVTQPVGTAWGPSSQLPEWTDYSTNTTWRDIP